MSNTDAEVLDLSVDIEIELAKLTAPAGVDLAAVETGLMFLRGADATLSMLDRQFRQHNISSGKFNMMLTIAAYSGNPALPEAPKPAQIARRLGVRRPTITGLIDNLEKDGFVERKPHATDGRALRLELTKKGRKLLDRLLPDYWATLNSLVAPLNAQERRGLVKSAEKMYDLLPAMSGEENK
jgi:MarR family transcriptional regulator, negative regulator of the multidrug operon emrRAB